MYTMSIFCRTKNPDQKLSYNYLASKLVFVVTL
uniref:Uncharacterized protein n=1 Tax=Anguilla anguilla TaxID=7936 RepID=A0A0E9WB74_ANGAN